MSVMGPEERGQRLSNYWVHYYDELRKQLSNYVADPEVAPPYFRGHGRRIQTWECLDGYIPESRLGPCGRTGWQRAALLWKSRPKIPRPPSNF